MLGRGGGPQPAALAEVRVDAVLGAELAQLMDRTLGAVAEETGLALVAEAAQGADLRPPGHHETAVAPGGAAATDILFEEHDAGVRLQLLQGHGRPEADETAADYQHIDRVPALQRGRNGSFGRRCVHPVTGFQGRGEG
ncbi:hypothetical protein D3C80_1646480 [compost metagenome]